ncbi:aspartate ammonia-lyase [Candidatus Cyanaurora vandensis]|uniref:aspartate ammonia-lyase n=1 Tax=Candidatus Cyanaurora vandensis TaxID=2714958 RepID=UPI00257BE9F2|nr:aspartate ammonia-lyase [Candidatus Cyanaurora vandensis]
MRTEKDSLGERQLPDDAYYGIQTLRAVENFPISGLRPHPTFTYTCALIKRAAALVNADLGCIPVPLAQGIEQAATEVMAGKFADQFVVDVYQAGAGTSHHMNINEVIANRALEILGQAKGDYQTLSPNDHVNYGQSTNDVIPTAIRLAALILLRDFLPQIEYLAEALYQRGEEFAGVVKSGRTHLQDAIPVRLGDSFQAWADIVLEHHHRLYAVQGELKALGLGGSACGTGLNTHPQFREQVIGVLGELTGFPLRPARNPMASMQSMAAFVQTSAALRNLAQDLTKLANDLRLLSSGPNTGLGEINLPAVQPGSSIMPNKYNPVIPEMLNMVCFQVMGNDTTILLAAQAGQLELNVMMPLIAHNLLQSLELMTTSLRTFRVRCVEGITANPLRCRYLAERSLALVTVLNPYLGYLKAAEVAQVSQISGRSLSEILIEKNYLNESKLAELLNLDVMSQMNFS